jgi:acyl-CoA reductase-like NAD-dependent aldehyde dehydrogenase
MPEINTCATADAAPESAPKPKRRGESLAKNREKRWAGKTPEERSEHARRIRNSLEAHIAAVVDRAPELTPEQIEKLRPLLAGTP